MAVHRGIIADVRPVTAVRLPSFRVVRPIAQGSIFELFGAVDGQPFSISVDAAIRITHQVQRASDAAVRVERAFVLLADLRQSTGSRVNLLADTRGWIRGTIHVHADVRLRVGLRVTRLADTSQRIGVGVSVSHDAAFTIYRVVLHEDHLILI